jgi:radical SAM superfamily enzyme YgiQ (UPF0313 family)
MINAPNANTSLFTSNSSTTKGVEHSDWANFPHLGILSIACRLDQEETFEGVYFDCVVQGVETILSFISAHREDVLAVGLSAITANFLPSVEIARAVKSISPEIKTVIGNDHFSAAPKEIMEKYGSLLDFGFVGNEIYDPFTTLLKGIQGGRDFSKSKIPGLVFRNGLNEVKMNPQAPESIFSKIDYGMIDRHFDHSKRYNRNFQDRIGNRIENLFNRRVTAGIPIEIARGCLKFAKNDACSFCSIQFGSMWRNSVDDAREAWQIIKAAVSAGYDYLYFTADELPLTFSKLLEDMYHQQPDWWLNLDFDKRPIMTGYARSDGMRKTSLLRKMREIGFSVLYVGIDAGAPKSLSAMNKPIANGNLDARAANLFKANLEALDRATDVGMKIKAGMILGHIGMNNDLLEKNVASYKRLIEKGSRAIVSVDVELLSPEPGSLDHTYLTNPQKAKEVAKRLGLKVSSTKVLMEVAEFYRNNHSFDRDQSVQDYVRAMMPELSFDQLRNARIAVRTHCIENGILVGEDV